MIDGVKRFGKIHKATKLSYPYLVVLAKIHRETLKQS